jgi:uncharacterized membrane protein
MSEILALIRSESDLRVDFAALQLKEDLHLIDACQIGIKENKKIKFHPLELLIHDRASDGLLLPALVGLLFFRSQHHGADRVESILEGLRLNEDFVKQLRYECLPGDSVLFLMVEDEDAQRIRRLLENLINHEGGRVVRTGLSEECEQQLRKLFSGQLASTIGLCEAN